MCSRLPTIHFGRLTEKEILSYSSSTTDKEQTIKELTMNSTWKLKLIINIEDTKVAEIITDKVILRSTEDGLDLLGNLYYQGFDKIIIHEKNITPEFFDLKTKIAGEILQKFAQYQMPLIIVGDFSKYKSKSLNDFIFESNKSQQINFIKDLSNIL